MGRILQTEDEWANAQMLLQMGFGITKLPAECDRLCDFCGHTGWSWDVGDKSMCLWCVQKRTPDL